MVWHSNLDGVKMYYETIDDKGYPHTGFPSVILKECGLNDDAHSYEFVYNVLLTPNEMFEVAEWCEKNINGIWLVGSTHSGLDFKLDAVAFKLRWT